MRRAPLVFAGIAGILGFVAGTSMAGIQAPTVVRAGVDGSFSYTWRFVADQQLVSGGYHWIGLQNVTGGLYADCFCDPIYCTMLPGDEIEVYVYGNLTDISQSGFVENHFSDCGYGFTKNTQIISPTTSVDDPAAPSLKLWAAPNPCRESSWIHYSLPAEGRVRLTMHDVSGRRVATLVEADESAGPHQVSWNVEGDAGKLPPAVYFAALQFQGRTRMQRILVIQ